MKKTTKFLLLGLVAIFSIYATTQIRVGQIAATGTPSSTTFLRGDGTWNAPTAVLADADYGDITVSSSGTVLTIDNLAVTNAKINDLAYSKLTGVPDAAADGSTKGIASFTANDFNSSSGNISIDYTNGQAADGSHKGFLSSTDWTTFNNKLTLAKYITRETPSGSVNGSNTTYTLANTPVAGTESVYLNGVLQEPGAGNDYTISSATITYLTAPATGDRIRVTYISQ